MGRPVRDTEPKAGSRAVIFSETPLAGAFVLEIEPSADSRGFFARTVCHAEFAKHGLSAAFVQQSVSWNPHAGTIRGLHYQGAPYEEDKLVRVTRGAIFDVIVDIRPDSRCRGSWFGVELSAENRKQIYVPKGFAHGFQTTKPETEVLYEVSEFFHPELARGVRWNDADLAIKWPDNAPITISSKDRNLPLFQPPKAAAR